MAVFSSDIILKALTFLAAVYTVSTQMENNRCTTPDGDTSKCILYYYCKHVMDVFDQIDQLNSSIKALLKSHLCGVEANNPKVCCPLKPILKPKETPFVPELRNANKCTPEKCIRIRACKPIMDLLNPPITSELRALLQSHKCGLFSANEPKVCCPETITPEPPIVARHRNIRLLPKDCGVLDTESKLLNGNKTGLFEFPWMALLSYKTKSGPKFRCGATILNNRYILTAAHCITNIAAPLVGVRVGDHDIYKSIDCEKNEDDEEVCAPPFQDLAIEEIVPHPDYNTNTFSNDIGLLRVTEMNLTLENIRPVCLPLERTRMYNFTGRNVVVTGWGVTETGFSSPDLLKITVPMVPQTECVTSYASLANITYLQLCAGGQYKSDACGGDSGGPLHVVARLHKDSRLIQQGIVSFGFANCVENGLPGVYTRVAYYMEWILDNIKP